MTTTQDLTGLRTIALDQIRAERNVRELNQHDVDALANSIELVGQLVPAIVYADGESYVLVAGHKRYAALRQLGRNEIRAEVSSREAEHSDRAVENIVRTQLNPYEEAQAVQAMLANGLSEDGAARPWAGRRRASPPGSSCCSCPNGPRRWSARAGSRLARSTSCGGSARSPRSCLTQ